MNRYLALVCFLVLAIGGGLAIGYLTRPGDWYAELTKPFFTPPGWLFGPVWTVLYVLIGVTGWRVWLSNRRGRVMMLWWVQIALNFLWSPIFFAAHQIGLALADIAALLVVILAFMVSSRREDPVATWLFAPYLAWVAFATALNASILVLN